MAEPLADDLGMDALSISVAAVWRRSWNRSGASPTRRTSVLNLLFRTAPEEIGQRFQRTDEEAT